MDVRVPHNPKPEPLKLSIAQIKKIILIQKKISETMDSDAIKKYLAV